MDDLTNPPTPPLDEEIQKDIPGEPISPEVSDSDVYLNGTSTSTDLPSKDLTHATDVVVNPNKIEDADTATGSDLDSTTATAVEPESDTKPSIADASDTIDENILDAELQTAESTTSEFDTKNVQDEDGMEVDNDEPASDLHEVEMKEADEERHDEAFSNVTSHSKSDEIVDEPKDNDELKEESKEESKNVSKKESKDVSKEESKDVSKEESKDVSEEESKDVSKEESKSKDVSEDQLEGSDANEGLHQTLEDSARNLDESGLNDSTGEEKHRTEEVDMENIESRDTTVLSAEDPFDAVRNNTSMEDFNESERGDVNEHKEIDDADIQSETERNEGNENLNKDHDDTDVHNENERDDENESHDESAAAGGEADVTEAHDSTVAEDGNVRLGDGDEDIEQGKGIDEALSLLPDSEREISDADKERALQAEVDAAESTTHNENDEPAEVTLCELDDDANKDTTEAPHDEVETETTENVDLVTTKENLELLSRCTKRRRN